MASFGEQYFGVDFSMFPTQRPTLNFVLLAFTFFCVLVILRQLLKGLVFVVKQEHAFWGVPEEPVASFLWGHGPLVCTYMHPEQGEGEVSILQYVGECFTVCVTADVGPGDAAANANYVASQLYGCA